jgi:hypothetical protein
VRLRLLTKKRLPSRLNIKKFIRSRPVVVVSLPISYSKSGRANLGPEDKPGLEFVNDIVGGVIPREFIPAVQKGLTSYG